MKTGIITFHNANNYGAVLQCYALSEVLLQKGHDVELINLPLHEKSKNGRTELRNKIAATAFKSFRKDFLPNATNSDKRKDVYFFGSDQIWNLDITKSNFQLYFGSWVKSNIPKIAYAASFGNAIWKFEDQTEEVKNLLGSFKEIGVRELSGVKICQEQLGTDCSKVLDPTMLLQEYDKLFKKKSISNAMVCYVFEKDELKINAIQKIAKNKSLKPILLNDMRFRKQIKSVPFPSVSTWLAYLNTSELVLTDSFHCMVFAILFKKNFIAIPAKLERVDRMLSLLKDLGLESRFFMDINKVSDSSILNEDIDYALVGVKLDKLRKESYDFLEKSLNSI